MEARERLIDKAVRYAAATLPSGALAKMARRQRVPRSFRRAVQSHFEIYDLMQQGKVWSYFHSLPPRSL